MTHRYDRQEAIPQIGREGQKRIESANVLVVGVGALGSVSAELLVRAGVRTITLCDYDIVEESNLARQSLYTTKDIGAQKVDAAKSHLQEINPHAAITTIAEPFSASTTLRGYDIIIDGTDSLHTRMVLGDAAKKHGIPLVVGAASGTRGFVFVANGSPCLQCIMHGKRSTDDCESGILGAATHAIASLQAAAAMRTLLDDTPKGLVEIDVWQGTVRTVAVQTNPSCSACKGQYRYLAEAFRIEYCAAANRLQARTTTPRSIALDTVAGEVIARYASAVRVRVGNGGALVHKHGMIEFENVPEKTARAFAQKLLNEK